MTIPIVASVISGRRIALGVMDGTVRLLVGVMRAFPGATRTVARVGWEVGGARMRR